MATLYVNKSDSRCGRCGENADPYELKHDETMRYDWKTQEKIPGCGEVFDGIASDYVGFRVNIEAMRPDLPWVGWEDEPVSFDQNGFTEDNL